MKPFVERMVNEHKDLAKKLAALKKMLPNIEAKEDFALLSAQGMVMAQYIAILEERLQRVGVYVLDNKYFENIDEALGAIKDRVAKK